MERTPFAIGRRRLLQAGLGSVTGALVGCAHAGVSSPQLMLGQPIRVAPPAVSASFADLELTLRAAPDRVSLLEGPATRVWRFSAQLQHGPSNALVQDDSSYLGPTLRVKRGQSVRVRFDNAIGEATIVHWHGLDVAAKDDGHPSYAVGSGGQHVYDFEIRNRAGTYWYHAHPDGRTGPQVYRGLAGLLLVSDDDEERLALPDGDRELNLVLQDRTFDEDNQLVYAPAAMRGFLGEQVLVSGQVARTKEVRRGPHRLRILNGSNSRIYDLAWSDGSALTILGTDGGLLDAPIEREHVVLAPGQRLDLWANFGSEQRDDIWLESRGFDDIGPTMGMGSGGEARLANGAPIRIQHFIAGGSGSNARPPKVLMPTSVQAARGTISAGAAKTFAIGMGGMRWVLNGRAFEMRAVAANERVRLGAVEDWEFFNPSGAMSMAHPIHVHGSQFRVIQREAGTGSTSLRSGILDEGWQDTVLVLPGDRVRIRKRFEHHAGLFLYHCHNLEHEDMGMMRNFLVEGT